MRSEERRVDAGAFVTFPIPDDLRTPANAAIVRHLAQASPSAHSDVADELQRALQGAPRTTFVCPDPAAYAWLAAATPARVVFAVACGSSSILVRLPPDRADEARGDGLAARAEVGSGWYELDPFRGGTTLAEARERSRRWCAVARAAAG